jgi:hypothetical protein
VTSPIAGIYAAAPGPKDNTFLGTDGKRHVYCVSSMLDVTAGRYRKAGEPWAGPTSENAIHIAQHSTWGRASIRRPRRRRSPRSASCQSLLRSNLDAGAVNRTLAAINRFVSVLMCDCVTPAQATICVAYRSLHERGLLWSRRNV